ncbi:MAG: tetratricopeptide (TPR) repeat protein [Myxococcota bacterium]|jgi:tetratricopeptide (TPR) repeat protein
MSTVWTCWLLCAVAQAAPAREARRAVRAAEQSDPLHTLQALSHAHKTLSSAPHPRPWRAEHRLATVEVSLPAARYARIQALLGGDLTQSTVLLELARLYLAAAAYSEQITTEAAAICGTDPACEPLQLLRDTDPGRAERERAILIFEGFLEQHPAHPRADEARYLLSGALIDSGALSDARRTLNRLIGGSYTGLALLRRGELSLQTGDLFGALADYDSAARALPDDQVAYARYRTAVCLRRLHRDDEAAVLLAALLDEPAGPLRDAAADMLATLQSDQP